MTHTIQLDDYSDLHFKLDTQYPNELFDQPPRYRATYKCNNLILSVIYGGGCYGEGPDSDQHELAVMRGDDSRDFIPLSSEDDVCGWVSAKDITRVMHTMQRYPDEIHNLNLDVN